MCKEFVNACGQYGLSSLSIHHHHHHHHHHHLLYLLQALGGEDGARGAVVEDEVVGGAGPLPDDAGIRVLAQHRPVLVLVEPGQRPQVRVVVQKAQRHTLEVQLDHVHPACHQGRSQSQQEDVQT